MALEPGPIPGAWIGAAAAAFVRCSALPRLLASAVGDSVRVVLIVVVGVLVGWANGSVVASCAGAVGHQVAAEVLARSAGPLSPLLVHAEHFGPAAPLHFRDDLEFSLIGVSGLVVGGVGAVGGLVVVTPTAVVLVAAVLSVAVAVGQSWVTGRSATVLLVGTQALVVFTEFVVLRTVVGEEPIQWMLAQAWAARGWCAFWVACILGLVWATPPLSAHLPKIVTRKLFHVVASAMFLPAAVSVPSFLGLACAVALQAMVAVEILRARRVGALGRAVDAYMTRFADSRDAGLILTHMYLLLGCALPLWLGASAASPWTLALSTAGIVGVGLGDAASATVGRLMGAWRWWFLPSKTLEGTVAGAAAMAVSFWLLGCGAVTAVVVATLLSFFETATRVIDNLTVPVYAICLVRVFADGAVVV